MVLSIWLDGIERVTRAPMILAGVWLAMLAASLPLALSIREEVAAHLGASVEAESAAAGVNYDWMQEFAAQATDLGKTLRPTIIGFAAPLDNASAFLDATPRPLLITTAAVAYLAAWLLLAGGILDRLARDRPVRAHGFFAASGTFFFRFLRLGIVSAALYGTAFGLVHPWLLGDFYDQLIASVTVERTAFFTRVSLYLVFLGLLGAVNLVFDYAKVRAVVEDRRSMLGALLAAVRFLRRNGRQAVALYLANVALLLGVVAGYGMVAPGAGSAGPSMWVGLAIGQAYVVARLWVKLVFWSSEIAQFQARLAHAGYVARRVPAWPDSPAAEAVSGTSPP
jgi:hypothetical protein